MADSILRTVKQQLDIDPANLSFDTDIKAAVNAALMSCNQLGVGPDTPVIITDDTTTWEAIAEDSGALGIIQTYVYLKAKLIFDPPGSSYVIGAVERQVAEYEHRLIVAFEEEVV